jgi:hypothetical protein
VVYTTPGVTSIEKRNKKRRSPMKIFIIKEPRQISYKIKSLCITFRKNLSGFVKGKPRAISILDA